MIERDCLSACMTRLGCGFTPPSEIVNARFHFTNIQHLLNEMERIKDVPKHLDVKIQDRLPLAPDVLLMRKELANQKLQ
jgi:hypothetical protein